MAKVVVAGDAVVVTSKLKLEDIRNVKKYRPNELTLMGGEDGKEPVFMLDVGSDAGSLSAFGACFGRESRDENKLAQITLRVNGNPENVKEWFADAYGGALMSLNALEEKLPAVVEEIKAQKQKVMEAISVTA